MPTRPTAPTRRAALVRLGSAATAAALAPLAVTARAAEGDGWLPIEREVAEAVKSPAVTIVHFWAPWCPNCLAELKSGGWKKFADDNPKAAVIFITVRDERDGAAELAKFGLGPQKNFRHLQHPNPSRRPETEMTSFMGLRVGWTPATWIYRNNRLRFALNYGQVRFNILQQLVDDTDPKWL